MVKIAVISGDFPPNARGTGYSAFNITHFLHSEYQHEIIVICRQGIQSDSINFKKEILFPFFKSDTSKNKYFGKIFRLSIPKIPLYQILINRIKINKILKKEKPSIVIAVSPGIYSLPKEYPYFIKNGGSIYVYNYHRKLDSPYSIYIKLFGKVLFILEKKMFQRAIKVISVSKFESKVIQKIFELPSSKTTSISNGITEIIDNPPILNRKKIKNILFVGQLNEIKGVKDLIHAFSEISLNWPNLHLNIVGTGFLEEFLRKKYKKLIAQNKITFHGYLNKEKLTKIYSEADLLIVPSIHDACPNVVLEAFGYGIPVLGSKVGGIPELIKENKTGLLFPPKSPGLIVKKIDFLLNDPDLYIKMILNVIQAQNKMSWRSQINKFEKIIKNHKHI